MARSDELQEQLHRALEEEAQHLERFGPEPEQGGTALLYYQPRRGDSLAAAYAKFDTWCLLSPEQAGTVFDGLPEQADWFTLCQAMTALLDDSGALVMINYPGDPIFGKGHPLAPKD